MEKRIVWFHIGFHKTGTTAIQNTFDGARDILASGGVLFPHVGFSRLVATSSPGASHGHGLIARALRSNRELDPEEKIIKDITDEIVSSGHPRIFLSSELIAAPGYIGAPVNIPIFMTFLNNEANARQPNGASGIVYEPQILVYVRRQDTWIDSMYREILCWSGRRETKNFHDFVKSEGKEWIDYKARLTPWRKVFGDENIFLFSYEETVSRQGVLAEVCEVIGLENENIKSLTSRAEAARKKHNPSLRAGFVDMMRAINCQSDYTKFEKSMISNKLRTKMEEIDADESPLFDKDTWCSIRDMCADGNKELQKALAPGRCQAFLFSETIPEVSPAKQLISFESAKTLITTVRNPAFDGSHFDLRGSFGTITTLRQSMNHTLEFVHYHLNLGVDCVVLFFDDPKDPAIDTVSEYDRVIVVKCDNIHWYHALGYIPDTNAEKLKTNMRIGSEILSKENIEWGICIDADELIWHKAGRPIQAHLKKMPRNIGVVKAKSLEGILTDNMPNRSFKSNWFRRRPYSKAGFKRWIKQTALDLQLGKKRELTRFGFFGHVEGKGFFRLRHTLEEYKHHSPIPASQSARILDSSSVFILHYDCQEFNEWKIRWHRRIYGDTNAINISVKRHKQQEMIRSAFEKGDVGLVKLYKNWFYVGYFGLLYLRIFKLITRVELEPTLFDRPTKNVAIMGKEVCKTEVTII